MRLPKIQMHPSVTVHLVVVHLGQIFRLPACTTNTTQTHWKQMHASTQAHTHSLFFFFFEGSTRTLVRNAYFLDEVKQLKKRCSFKVFDLNRLLFKGMLDNKKLCKNRKGQKASLNNVWYTKSSHSYYHVYAFFLRCNQTVLNVKTYTLRYSLRPILLDVKVDTSTTKMCLDTFILALSNICYNKENVIGQEHFWFCILKIVCSYYLAYLLPRILSIFTSFAIHPKEYLYFRSFLTKCHMDTSTYLFPPSNDTCLRRECTFLIR
jgi:hypothetical protein